MQRQAEKHPQANLVAVDCSDERRAADFDEVLVRLRSQGWSMGGPDGLFALMEAGGDEADAVDRPGLLICRSKAEVDRHRAIKPSGFGIIRALGCGRLETDLAASVREGAEVDKVLVGFNWTLVRAGDLCGIARSPGRDTEGARTVRPQEGFAGKSLSEIAAYLCSVDPLSRSIGLAAVNAYWNRSDPPDRVKPYIRRSGGLGGIEPPGDGVVIIGGFRGAQKRLAKARIVEREPKPGDIPAEEAPQAYRQANILAITAQTLMNASLEPILHASRCVPHRMLVGPSSPACPIVFDHGIDETSGAVIVDPDAAEKFIIETGTMIMLDHIARSRCLRRDREESGAQAVEPRYPG